MAMGMALWLVWSHIFERMNEVLVLGRAFGGTSNFDFLIRGRWKYLECASVAPLLSTGVHLGAVGYGYGMEGSDSLQFLRWNTRPAFYSLISYSS